MMTSPVIAESSQELSRKEQLKQRYYALLEIDDILLPHNGTYFLPLAYQHNPNTAHYADIQTDPSVTDRGVYNTHHEAEIQVSFLVVLSREFLDKKNTLFLGYTQKSWWQMYNAEWSRPFRETNYQPEIFVRHVFESPSLMMGWESVGFDVGYMHHSNGQIQERSRSWDRVFGRMAYMKGNTMLILSGWYRLPESKADDNNPTIQDYYGFGSIEVDHIIGNKFRVGLDVRPGKRQWGYTGKLMGPAHQGVSWFIKADYGSSASLNDYDHATRRLGFGFQSNTLLRH
jgi:phospholipase A1